MRAVKFLHLALLTLVPAIASAAPSDYDADSLSDLAVFDSSTGKFSVRFSSRLQSPGGDALGTTGDTPVVGDFDNDGVADQGTFNRSTGEWTILPSGARTPTRVVFGLPGDVPVPASYSGFECTDLATFNPQSTRWTISNCRVFGPPRFVSFGNPGDIAAPADYDGDKLADIAVVDPRRMSWAILRTSKGFRRVQFGLPGDIPIPADYNGDGIAQPAVFRPSTNEFIVLYAGGPIAFPAPNGLFGDRPVSGDVDGDGKADLVVFHPSLQSFDIVSSLAFAFSGIRIPAQTSALQSAAPSFPAPIGTRELSHTAVAGDFDRDFRSEFIFTRPANGLNQWVVQNSLGQAYFYEFGFPTDTTLSGDTNGDQRFEPIVVRNRQDGGLDWFILQPSGRVQQTFFGLRGDKPILGDFDCDGKDDLTVIRNVAGGNVWYFNLSSERLSDNNIVPAVSFGLPDDPAYAADIDGDGCDDLVMAQDFAGGYTWFWYSLRNGKSSQIQWGLSASDKPL